MLPLLLVLLTAKTVFGAASVGIQQASINEFAPATDRGGLVSSFLTDRCFELIDGGDSNVYILTIQQILNDLANQPDALSQSLAVAQTIAILGELGTGSGGDCCAYATAVDAYAGYLRTGNSGPLRSAIGGVIGRLQKGIDTIVQLASNPASLRYSTGVVGGCKGGGRSYQFEPSWDALLSSCNPYQIGLINEEYCATKRLYSAFNARSNNVGAAVSAVSIAPITSICGQALAPLANFLRAACTNAGNVAAAGASAKAALANYASNYRL